MSRVGGKQGDFAENNSKPVTKSLIDAAVLQRRQNGL